MKEEKKVINDLVFFNDLKIVQNSDYFKFSLDSILLPNFIEINYSDKMILDLCTGNAPIPLVLSTKTKAKIIGVELQKDIYELAKETIELNHLEDQIEILNDNAINIPNKYISDSFDIITCNPPYFKYTKNSILNENDIKSLARHEITIKLDDIIKISKKLLKNGGSLCIIHRTDRLIEIVDLMKKNNIEPKRIRFVYPKINSESNLVMIEGKKNGNVGLKILPPLYVHNENNTYTEEVLKMFGK